MKAVSHFQGVEGCSVGLNKGDGPYRLAAGRKLRRWCNTRAIDEVKGDGHEDLASFQGLALHDNYGKARVFFNLSCEALS